MDFGQIANNVGKFMGGIGNYFQQASQNNPQFPVQHVLQAESPLQQGLTAVGNVVNHIVNPNNGVQGYANMYGTPPIVSPLGTGNTGGPTPMPTQVKPFSQTGGPYGGGSLGIQSGQSPRVSMKVPIQQSPTVSPTPTQDPAARAIQTIRQAHPELNNKISDDQIRQFYSQYGDRLTEGMPTPTPSPVPGVAQVGQMPQHIPAVDDSFVNFVNTTVLPITRAAGIPDAVAAAQTAGESTHGRSTAAKTMNNYHGIMSFDGGMRHLAQFSDPKQSVQAYVNTIKNLIPNPQQYANNPLAFLKALQTGLNSAHQRYEADNPDPMQYVYDISHTPEWEAYGGGSPMEQNPMGWSQ